MHILYIEDNPIDADLAHRHFARHVPEVKLERVESYAEAVAKLEHCTQEQPIFDLVLTDMRLPDGNGLKLLNYIRNRALPLPVIVLTGMGSEEMAVSALKSGADDYITKRHDYLDRLPSALENALKRFRAANARHSRPLRVLYAEHYKADIELTLRHLTRYAPHMQITVVHDSADVLAHLSNPEQASNFDVLLLDYRLPEMNALDLLKELEYTGLLTLPVVLVTGQGDEAVAVQALRLGVADYLVKNPGYLFQLPRMLENTHTQTLLQRERAALFESEQRYRALFDRAPVAIFTKDLQGRYTSANIMAMEILDADPLGLTDIQLLGADNGDELRKHDRAVLESGKDQLLEEHLLTSKGERVFFSRKSPLYGQGGKLTGLMGISLEITERIRAEEAQLENQRRLSQLAEHIDEAIWLMESESYKLLYIGPAYERIWGRSIANIYDNPFSLLEAVIPEDQERVYNIANTAIRGNPTYLEFRIHRPDGSIAWIAAQTFPIQNEAGEVYRIAGVARDITERRRSEEHLQQQERLVTVGQMAAGIAHDFNNILAIIMLYTQMLQVSVPSSSHQRHLTTIYQQSLQAANLVQQILDFSRRSTMERVKMDLVPFVKELAKLWQRTLPENIRVELEIAEEPLVISADSSRLQQALMNMAINARDAMSQGGTLQLSIFPITLLPEDVPPLASMTPGRWIQFCMKDNGMGIAPDVLPHVFDPFFTTKSTGQGTGLGLAQVYGIIRQLDGFIQVESEMGKA
jgi:two-component system, cell cycle sensor histidine kinase and response regulator CckA